MTDASLSSSAKKVQDALTSLGLQLQVIEMPASTRTAADAALAVGCDVGQIVKSLVFKTKRTGRPILVIASGKNRVNEKAIEALVDEPLGKADADFVRQRTGFVIGGVPPCAHSEKLETFVDADLLQYPVIWAAAGTPNAVFSLTPAELLLITSGRTVDIH